MPVVTLPPAVVLKTLARKLEQQNSGLARTYMSYPVEPVLITSRGETVADSRADPHCQESGRSASKAE